MYSDFISLFSEKILEDNRYKVLTMQGPFELRLYQRMTYARVSLTGPYDLIVNKGMEYLKEYLEGNNFKVEKIESTYQYFQIIKENSLDIGIILPASITLKDAPKPINRVIKLGDFSPCRIGALRYGGEVNIDAIKRRGNELKRWLDYKGLKTSGPLKYMSYEKKIYLPFSKTNEVQLDVN
jgi:hypothetical protein